MKVYKNGFFEFWHCVVPVGSNNNITKVKEMRRWCRSNCEGNWSREDLHNQSNFVFDLEKDVVLFALRWS